jgi:hypothetical protein
MTAQLSTSRHDIDAAVQSARAAFDGEWEHMRAADRGRHTELPQDESQATYEGWQRHGCPPLQRSSVGAALRLAIDCASPRCR